MNSATTSLLQSKFFTPVFNTAIFDGPVRMYFSQAQEPEALKLYFRMQSMVGELRHDADNEPHVFIMIYPNKESFVQSFDLDATSAVERLGPHVVFGIRGPLDESDMDVITHRIETQLRSTSSSGEINFPELTI
ncbi:MAG: hypothetical protein K2X47_13710 [Bdellovibrionales bacterium]|nr:hypothetical protein [Bdellovibrionales bacterium]